MAVPINVAGDPSTPLEYVVPGSTAFIPRAASCSFDGTGASGAFLPVMTWLAQNGDVIGRYIAPQVAAGDSAEVSWAPFLRPQAAATSGLTNLSVAFGRVNPSSPPVISAGATDTITWDSVTVVGSGITFASGSPRQVTIDDGGTILVALNVAPDSDWPNAAAGYIQISHLYNLVEQILMQTIYAAHPGVDGFAPVGSSPGNLCSFAFLSNDTKGANPAHWQAQLKNTTASNFTLGIDTSFALARVSPWVNF